MSPGIGSLYLFPEGQILAFALTLLRILSFFVAWPVFGTNSVPVPIKILLSIVVAMLMFPTIHIQNAANIITNDNLILLVMKEVVVGLGMGFFLRLLFFAVSMGAEIISISIGLNSAQMFNPAAGGSVTVVEEFQLTIATLFFLALNGHHMFLSGMAESFHIIPLANMSFELKSMNIVIGFFQQSCLMGLKIGSPVMIAIFLANLTMAILGRAVPQINVLVTSFPVTILLGISVMILVMPLMTTETENLMNLVSNGLIKVMKEL